MSAERETILEVKVVTDHDCGNYRIGEIDTLPDEAVRKYILRHGEYGYTEMLQFGAQLLAAAQLAIREVRALNYGEAAQEVKP